ncbi:MAG: AraC family transcriptional regulator [Thermoleophilaceae bacterium]|jgi:AraC family transcriptional regulator of adaptative response / methylphosphotriester-DNA alkyltransferase methyltransferase|nr:AraC family transcriptional regulator [Thermoleophilaceae bacterium]MEA2400609.1 AraC family transcriptional regulator [Thermoleophilaceae bacterium]
MLFQDALIAIRRDYADETLSLAGVAHSIATSRRQLQRVFAEQGTSFRRELQRVRMARAADLLRQEALPVAAVARAVGYRQAAQFSKAFRRHHGHPPSEARRAQRTAPAAQTRGSAAARPADGHGSSRLGQAAA